MKSFIFLALVILPYLAVSQPQIRTVNVLAIYACERNDHYPFPTEAWRQALHKRLIDFYKTMSYGRHIIRIREATNNGDFFRSKYSSGYYKKNYDNTRHEHGFAMFNEEILNQVKDSLGEEVFADADIVIIFGTDGGRDWYIDGVNATGYGALGVSFEAGQRIFERRPGGGGFTVELGSDCGTAEPEDDHLLSLQQIHWTLAHEYAHWLGLRHRPKRLGIYSLLTPELYGNSRMPEYGPQPLDIFEIIELGWLDESDPERVLTISENIKNRKIELRQIRATNGVVLLRLNAPGIKKEIFVTYHNQNNPFDGVYAGKGLLIWRKGYVPELIRSDASTSDKITGNASGQNLSGAATDFLDGKNRKNFSIETPSPTKTSRRQSFSDTFKLTIADIKLSKNKAVFKLNLLKN